MAEKIKILEMIGSVLPKKKVELEKGSFDLPAMKAGTIMSVALDIKKLIEACGEQGVTWENYKEPESIMKIAMTFVTDFSKLLSTVTNIEENDLKELPVEVLLQIVEASIEVNMQAKDKFLKNWNSLVETATKLGLVEKTKPEKKNTEKTKK